MSVLLSINFMTYSMDFLQLLVSSPSPNFTVLHLCSVLQFIRVNTLEPFTSQQFRGSAMGEKCLPTKTPKWTGCPLPICVIKHGCKRCTCTHNRCAFVGQNTHILLAQHWESLLAQPVYMYLPHPPSPLFDQAFKQLLFACMNTFAFWSWNKGNGEVLSPWNNSAVAGRREWARDRMSCSARPDPSCSLM